MAEQTDMRRSRPPLALRSRISTTVSVFLLLAGCCREASSPTQINTENGLFSQAAILPSPFSSYQDYAKSLAFGDSAGPSDIIAVGQPYYGMIGGEGLGRVFLYRSNSLWSMIDEPEELTGASPTPVLADDCYEQAHGGLSQSGFAQTIASNGKFIFVAAPGACETLDDIADAPVVPGAKIRRHIGRVYAYALSDSRFPMLSERFDPPNPANLSSPGGFGEALAVNANILVISNFEKSNSPGLADGIVYVTRINTAPASAPTYTQIVPSQLLPPNWSGTFGRKLAVTSSLLYVTEERFGPAQQPAQSANIVHVYRLADLSEVGTLSDPSPSPESTFGKWLTANGDDVYTGGDEAVYVLTSSAANLVVKKPDLASPDINISFGAAVAANDQWLAVSAPSARPHGSNPSQVFRGYIAVYRKTDLTKPERIYTLFPCLHNKQSCFRQAGYPGTSLAIVNGELWASDPSFAPNVLEEEGLGLGAIYVFRLP